MIWRLFMFKKLLPLFFLFAGFQANAAPFQFQFEDTISYSTIAGLSAGQSALITVGLDNGGTSLLSQIWTASDLTSVTFDFNNGGLVTTFNSPWGGAIYGLGNFTTNGSGVLTGVMTAWTDGSLGTDWSSSVGVAVTPDSWWLNGWNAVYLAAAPLASGLGEVGLTNVSDMRSAANWSKVAEVPEPSIIALFGLGLVGIGFARRRQS
jgi:hypothetical protein